MLGLAAGGVSRCYMCCMMLQLGRIVPMCRSYRITRMDPKKNVFLLTPIDSDLGDAAFVAKVVATPYPEQLHQELSRAGLAPELREPVQKYPGGMILCFPAPLLFIPPVAGCMKTFTILARYMLPAMHGGCFCMQQPLHCQSGVFLCVNCIFPSAYSACPKCLGSATLASFNTMCATLAKPGTCQRSIAK